MTERPSAQPYDQSPAFFQVPPPGASACVESGWQAPYHQAPENYPMGKANIRRLASAAAVPPPYYGGRLYQAPQPLSESSSLWLSRPGGPNQRQPGYQKAAGIPSSQPNAADRLCALRLLPKRRLESSRCQAAGEKEGIRKPRRSSG